MLSILQQLQPIVAKAQGAVRVRHGLLRKDIDAIALGMITKEPGLTREELMGRLPQFSEGCLIETLKSLKRAGRIAPLRRHYHDKERYYVAGQVPGNADPKIFSGVLREVLSYLERNGPATIYQLVEGTGHPYNSVQDRLKNELQAAEPRVMVVGRAKRCRVFALTQK